jgi:hypothetical protein
MAEFTPVPVEPGISYQGDPSTATPRPARPAGLLRWGVALVVVALVVGVVSVGTVLLAAGGATSAIEGWIPSGTVMYLEGRADLPGDQRANVGNIVAKFPGFKDQASLDSKIDQALDQMLQGSGITWTTDLKPWVGGEVGVAVTRELLDFGAAAQKDPSSATLPDRGAVLLASVKDVTAATAWVAKTIGGTPSTTPYLDGSITTVDKGGRTVAWAVRGTVLLIGPEASVKAALDTKGASPVAASASFVAARKAAPNAYLGFAFVDAKPFYDALLTMSASTGGMPQACLDTSLAALPDWMAGYGRAADGALVSDLVEPVVASAAPSGAAPKDTGSAIAAHLPAGTLVAFEGRQAGPTLVAAWSAGIKSFSACYPSQAGVFNQVDKALAVFGGVESLVGWAGDTAFAVTRDGTTWGGGIAAIATDPAGAARTLNQLKAGLAIGGASSGVTYTEQPYAAGTIGVITVPTTGGNPLPQLAATAQGDVFAIGTVDFVKGVLDTKASASLSTSSTYMSAIAAAGGAGVGDVFIDIGGLRTALETLLPADQKARYDAEIKPFLEPFSALASVTKAPAGTTTARIALTFK